MSFGPVIQLVVYTSPRRPLRFFVLVAGTVYDCEKGISCQAEEMCIGMSMVNIDEHS